MPPPTGPVNEGVGGLGGALGGLNGTIQGLFGANSVATQFLIWGVISQLAGAALSGVTAEIQQAAFAATPDLVNSPAQLADMVARGLLSEGSGKNNAAKGGIGGESFDELVKAAQRAPGYGELVALLQRGEIGRGHGDGTEQSFDGALSNSGMPAGWIDHLAKLAVLTPSAAEVFNAWLEGQIDEGTAHTWLAKTGLDPAWWQIGYDANGQAPTPTQALELLNRRIIPRSGTGPDSVSYEQAFREGPWRNKWEDVFAALAEYLPPPRTITAMYHEGSVDKAIAADALSKQGLSTEWVARYLTAGTSTKTAASKDLSKTDIIDLYTSQLIDKSHAVPMLEAVGYDATESGYLLSLADFRIAKGQLTNAVNRIRSQFIGGALTAGQATQALTALGVPAAQTGPLIASWTILHEAAAPRLSASEIASAFNYSVITRDVAQARLETMGYSPHDAWIMLSVRNHGPLENEPAL